MFPVTKTGTRVHAKTTLLRNRPFVSSRKKKGFFRVAQEPNQNREPEPSEPFFPETGSGTGTAGTVFQEPKPEPEPSFPVKLY